MIRIAPDQTQGPPVPPPEEAAAPGMPPQDAGGQPPEEAPMSPDEKLDLILATLAKLVQALDLAPAGEDNLGPEEAAEPQPEAPGEETGESKKPINLK